MTLAPPTRPADLVPELSVRDLAARLAFWCGPCGFAVVFDRPEQGFASLDELFALPQLSSITVPDDAKSLLSLKSDSFQLTATTAYLESGFVLTSVLKINDNNQVKVLARRFGGQG